MYWIIIIYVQEVLNIYVLLSHTLDIYIGSGYLCTVLDIYVLNINGLRYICARYACPIS